MRTLPGLISRKPGSEPSFGDVHANYAREAQEESVRRGEGVFETLQCMSPFPSYIPEWSDGPIAMVILGWFFQAAGKYVTSLICFSLSLIFL